MAPSRYNGSNNFSVSAIASLALLCLVTFATQAQQVDPLGAQPALPAELLKRPTDTTVPVEVQRRLNGQDQELETASEPVFTLGPMPLLPPSSWTEDDEKSLPLATVNATLDALKEAAPTPTEKKPEPVISESQIVVPEISVDIAAVDADHLLDSPVDQIIVEPVAEPDYASRTPVMEQVDVTAKRLPPPSPFKAPETGFSVSSSPPPGFEDLAIAQTTVIDVVYGKRVIASSMATFDMGMLEFSDPAKMLAAVPDAKDSLELLNALSGPLDANADALCYSEYDTECGRLQPEIAALIFDETRFRAELFINPDYLETNYLVDSTYLPPSDTGAASVHSFSLSANGDRIGQIVNLSASSLVSYRESRLESHYDFDSKEGLSIDTLSLKHDARGWEYEAGAFRSRIQSAAFITEQNLIGARVSTSLNTRTDLKYAEATPLFTYLEQRSRVDILRGGQLLDSQFYNAGNQQLDTSRLPDGAYNVTVRIAGDAGTTQNTQYYFARTSALPPRGQPLYFAEAGQLALTRESVLPERTDSLWVRAGTAHRLRDNFGFEAVVSAIGDATLFEGGLVWFQPGLQFQARLLGGDSTGVSLRSVWQRDQFSFSADLRRVTGDKAVTVDSVDLLPASYTQANVTASLPLYEGRLLAQGRWDMRGSRDFKSLGVNYSRELRRFSRSTLSFNVDTTFSTDDSIVRLGVDWRWREQQRDAIFRPRLQYSGDTGTTDALLNARYNMMLRNDDRGAYRTSAFIDQAVDRSTLGARVSAETAYGIGEAELQYGFEGEQGGTAYVVNARFGVVSSGRQVAFGGRRANSSSVIIEVNGNAPDAVFEVLIGNQSHGYAQSGSRTIIALPPYETYDVRLASRGLEFVEFEQAVNSVTLYPGNVKTLSFTANRQIVVVGKVVDEEGYVIAHHKFTDLDSFASTDENGWFQIEITDVKPLTLKRGEASVCTIDLAIEDVSQNLVVLDEVVCR